MATLNEIIARAEALRKESSVNSIDPERVGSIMSDTLKYLNEFQLQSGSMGLDKIYTSISAMNADTSPVSDLTGKPLKAGQLAVVVTSDSGSADNGRVYRFDKPGWTYISTVAGLNLAQEPGTGDNRVMSQKAVTNLVSEYNVSVHFPTDGIDGTNRYTLETAIAKIPAALRNVGIKCSFLNEAGYMETWAFRMTKDYSNIASSWAPSGSEWMNTQVYTNNGAANKVLRKLYIDISGYTGSVSLDGMYIDLLARNVKGMWGMKFVNGKGELLFAQWMYSEESVQVIRTNGVYIYAEYNWKNMPENIQVLDSIPTDEAFLSYNDPRRENVENSNISDGAVTTEKLAEGAVTKSKLATDLTFYNTVLTGRLYGTAGDSITEGAGLTDFLSPDDAFAPISGAKKATYGYYIAKINGARWANYGLSGSTLGDVTVRGNDKRGFSKAGGRYTQMADGMDCLSIFFGWNDSAYGPQMKREEWLKDTYGATIYWPASDDQIGTAAEDGIPYATQEQYDACSAVTGDVGGIRYDDNAEYFKALYVGSSNDTTNTTFWGAWNVVLPYLINKYPTAKILLIVPYGCYELLKQCVRDAAKKYGLATYDFNDGSGQLFYDVTDGSASGMIDGQSIKSFRRSKLLADGVHPNDAGYRYMYPSLNAKLLSL